MKVLVIQQKMIGDVLASSIICQDIKLNYPDAEVHYMVHPNTLAVIDNNPFIDQVIVYDPKVLKGIKSVINFAKELKKKQSYDAILDVYGKLDTALISKILGSKIRVSQKKWYTSFLFTHTIDTSINYKNVSAIEHRLKFSAVLTNKKSNLDFPKIYLSDEELNKAKSLLVEQGLYGKKNLMIGILGSDHLKSLPAKEMALVLDEIAQNFQGNLLFNFMPNQKDDVGKIYDLCLDVTKEKIVIDFYTKSLREFLAVLTYCDALIGNEGGAVNMAKALNIPTFAIFSPWIKKSSWDMLSDNQKHVAVHLQDYYPEMYKDKHPKDFKKFALQWYSKLKLELFKGKLHSFLSQL